MGDPANPWSMNYFDPPKPRTPNAPLPGVPHQRRHRDIPDQHELFELQKGLQRLSFEIDQLPDEKTHRIRHEFQRVWKRLNRYLQEHAQQ